MNDETMMFLLTDVIDTADNRELDVIDNLLTDVIAEQSIE